MFLNEAYTTQIEKAGSIPYIFPFSKIENIEETLAPFSALLVQGGFDIDPSYYGEAIKEGSRYGKMGFRYLPWFSGD